MTSHRLRFLTSLSERLQSDLAAREQEQEDATSAPWREHAAEPGGGDEPAPEENAGPETADARAQPAAQVEPEQDAKSGAVPPPEAHAPTGAFASSEGERTPPPSVPWSETGMPRRLREAIASVRRVSHEMHEPPGAGFAPRGPAPFEHHVDYDHYPLDGDLAHEQPWRGRRVGRHAVEAEPEDGPVGFVSGSPYEERSPDDEQEALDRYAELEHEQPPVDDDHAYEAPLPTSERLILDDAPAPDDDRIPWAAHAGYEEPPAEYAPIGLDDAPSHRYDRVGLDHDDAPYGHPPQRRDPVGADDDDALYDHPAHRHDRIGLDDDAPYDERAALDGTADDPIWLEDGAGRALALGRPEDAQDPLPSWRRAKTRYRLHAAAFVVALAFVAIAGFGLGFLSDDGNVGAPPTRDALRAAAPPEATPPPTGPSAERAEPEQPAELGELVTVRLAPAPVAAVPEPAPAARASTRPPPLPPPPKPSTQQSAPVQPATTDRLLAGVVDDAAAALLEAQGAEENTADGAGGPFQPLFTKLPALRPAGPRVFVHYSAGAVGAPATAMHLVRHLKAEGFTVEARPVEFPIPTNSVRYFFEADRKEAEALRSSLEGQLPGGAALPVMDFTSYQPKPQPGLIEVWLRA